VPDVVPVAFVRSDESAQDALEVLRANGIKCAVGHTGPDEIRLRPAPPLRPGIQTLKRIPIIVAAEDEKRAREALTDLFAARWWLLNPSEQRYLAFEDASPEQLRHQAQTHLEATDSQRSALYRLAELLEQHRWEHVGQAFVRVFRHDDRLEEQTLDEWGAACGCQSAHAEAREPS
jgi:hypothetical protein